MRIELVAAVVTAAVCLVTVWAVPRPIGDLYKSVAGGQDVLNGTLGGQDDWSVLTDKTFEVLDGNGRAISRVGRFLAAGTVVDSGGRKVRVEQDMVEVDVSGAGGWIPLDSVEVRVNASPRERVWINQNWGTDLTYYYVYNYLGGEGMLALKALLLLVAFAALIGCMVRREVIWPIAVVMSAGVLIAARGYIDQRPNLTTLALSAVMLLLIHLSRRRMGWIWVAAGLTVVWSNMHGGFIFGIGMIGLWTLCRGITAVRSSGIREAVRRLWPMGAAVSAAILLCLVVTPFGYRNLTFPFAIQDAVWRTVHEWRPLIRMVEETAGGSRLIFPRLYSTSGFGSAEEFLVVLGILVGLLVARPIARTVQRLYVEASGRGGSRRGNRGGVQDETASAIVLFEYVLTAVVILMALSSRRFVPLAMIQFAPVLARHVQWALQAKRLPWPTVGFCAVIVVPVALYAAELKAFYKPAHFTNPPEAVFDRMVGLSAQPADAATFLNANGISGPMLHEWRWEGYLRMRCPQIQVFLGGRAHMIYSANENHLYQLVRNHGLAEPLGQLDVHMVLLPYGSGFTRLWSNLSGQWVPIYCDRKNILIVNGADSAMRSLIELAASGGLMYPSEHIEALSYAATMQALGPRNAGQELIAAIKRANELAITWQGYRLLIGILDQYEFEAAECVKILSAEYARLAEIGADVPMGQEVVSSQRIIALTLARHHITLGHREEKRVWEARAKAHLADQTARTAAARP